MQMSKEVSILKIDDILPNRFQPRIVFDENAINELTESIKEYGVIEPIIVRKVADKYEIIAGERRYKASVLAGKETIPAIITDLNDKDSAEIALIENVQRQNLTPIEEAVSYKKILDMGYMNQSELAEKLGKKQSTVANKLRLLNLTDTVQEALLQEKISERHARSLLRLPKSKQDEMLDRIIKERMTVRKTDEEINKILASIPDGETKVKEKEEPKMNNNDFMNQFNIPNTPIMENPVQQPSAPTPISPVASVQPVVSPVEPVQMNSIFNPVQPQVEQTISPKVEMEQPAPIMPQVEPTNPIVEPIAPTDTQTVQTINNEPATAENSDTPISGRFFNMFRSETPEDQPNVQQPSAPTPISPVAPVQPVVSPVEPVQMNSIFNPVQPQVEQPVTPQVEMEQPAPIMPQVEPIKQQEVEPIPMPTIPVAPEMSPVTPADVNPIPTFQLNDNQEFTNSSVVEMGTLQNRKMEEPTLQPLMEETNQAPKVSMKEIINMIRNCATQIEKNGYTIDTDELDFDDSYQVIFKINKND